eukprot:CAMPEP_0171516838 /NCGR_PEP_ID=MMETSP0959-20130129/4280_1 /TAXON_ID=87120 /ORGANISM="Aurantiochytrium limacinum, Strain ATCCMYA-1381" /LENGTH=58 /DNA_ID=CAMNT_0012055635 /DNA_START=74 /DNA_END=250 /DNA_ORIENTATION=-
MTNDPCCLDDLQVAPLHLAPPSRSVAVCTILMAGRSGAEAASSGSFLVPVRLAAPNTK